MSTSALSTRNTLLAHSGLFTQSLWIVGFAAATALGARFEIPHYPVPYTLQTLVVLLAGAFLGARNGAISQFLYLGAGLVGLPVFAGGAMGLARLIGPTGGYLLAFPLAAFIAGSLSARGTSLAWLTLSFGVSLLVVFVSGTLYLFGVYTHDFAAAFSSGFLIFSWWDVVKLGAATMIYHEVAKRFRRVGE
jgi:biotin transport system substrate-specific component